MKKTCRKYWGKDIADLIVKLNVKLLQNNEISITDKLETDVKNQIDET